MPARWQAAPAPRLTAEQIHAIGLREVARIEAEMDRHLRTLGFADGSIEARMAQLDATLQPAAGAEPRAQMLASYARDGSAMPKSAAPRCSTCVRARRWRCGANRR